jgi:glucose/arabinose dehydrogenase
VRASPFLCISVVVLAACASDGPTARGTTAPTPTPAPVSLPETAPPRPPPTTPPTTPSTTPTVTDDGDDTAATSTTSATTTTTTTLPPDPLPPNTVFDGLKLALEPVADVDKPTAVAWRDGDPAMYATTQPGPVYRIVDGVATMVIDLTGETFEALPGSERGVLGIAFDPRDGRMFVNLTDVDHNTRVVSFELDDGVAVTESRREVLFIEQPGIGHNGGGLVFDAAGNLYIGSGDGGASNGWDAQDTTKLLGAILRITPRLDGDGYDVPADNPFADGVADRPEVIARGLRNPWTFSLDDDTGDIWIGDVGRSDFEEISLMRRDRWGSNFGWPYFEGNDRRRSNVPDGLVPPVFAYPRTEGVAVMGGYVYRGEEIPALRGAYLFGDLTGPVWAIGAEGVSRLDVERVNTLVGWGEDPAGELYLLALHDGVFRLVDAADTSDASDASEPSDVAGDSED